MTTTLNANGRVPDPLDLTALPFAEYDDGPALIVTPGDDLSEVAAHFHRLELIVLPFPVFSDGRGLSLAGQLRALGYLGMLRARGHILPDQFRAALRAGFDEVEVDDALAARAPEEQWTAVQLGDGYRARVFGTGASV